MEYSGTGCAFDVLHNQAINMDKVRKKHYDQVCLIDRACHGQLDKIIHNSNNKHSH